MATQQWWRDAVIYQVYPRSFMDSNGDGVGDLPGVTQRLPEIASLGVDAIWLSPFFPSPQRDGGYDISNYRDVDPLFGSLEDFDRLLQAAHDNGLKVIVDLVPNHTSRDHAWFQQALKAAPDSPERDRYIFRSGRGTTGDRPPNNWQSVFGGDAWTRVASADGDPEEWYLHLFDPSQPDLNWESEWVRERFREILRFWLERGVDGFRVDVAHGLIKASGLPDYVPQPDVDSMGGDGAGSDNTAGGDGAGSHTAGDAAAGSSSAGRDDAGGDATGGDDPKDNGTDGGGAERNRVAGDDDPGNGGQSAAAQVDELEQIADTIAAQGDDAYSDLPEAPYWGQPGIHEIYRDWRRVLNEYGDGYALCGEAWVSPLPKLALWVRPDEMQQTFNFGYLATGWDATRIRTVIKESLNAFGAVGAPSTWVLSNHDVIRHATRLALVKRVPQGDGVGPANADSLGDRETGLRRARAATTLMLALPGSAYLYQGEELGLPEVVELPDDARQDPTWLRSGGKKYGRDGCRVPLPWERDSAAYGFSATGASWLPQPHYWADYARDTQRGDATSTLELYRRLLAERRAHRLGSGELEWLDGGAEGVIRFRNHGVTVTANLGDKPVALPEKRLLLASGPLRGGMLPAETAAWTL